MHCFPKAGQSCGFLTPLQDQAADANLRLGRIDRLHLEKPLRVVLAKFVAQPVTAWRNRAHAAPFAVADFEDLAHQLLSHAIAFPLHDARDIGFRTSRVPLSSCRTVMSVPCRMSSGSNPRDHDRHPETLGERLIFLVAHDRADVPRARNPWTRLPRRFKDRRHRRRHQHVRDEYGKILNPLLRACQTAIALAGAVVSKPMAKKTTFLSGLAARDLQAIDGANRRRACPRRAISTRAGRIPSPARAACRQTSKKSRRAAARSRAPCRSFRATSRKRGSPDHEPVRPPAGSK